MVKKRKLSGNNPDAVALLKVAVDFRSQKERAPLKGDMASLLSSSPDLSHLTPKNAYSKLRHIRNMFLSSALADTDLHALASRAWDPPSPNKDKEEDGDEEDGAKEAEAEPSLELLEMEAEGYWKETGLSPVLLKMGMEWIDRSKAKKLESKWRQHGIDGMAFMKKYSSLLKGLYNALLSTSSKDMFGLPDSWVEFHDPNMLDTMSEREDG